MKGDRSWYGYDHEVALMPESLHMIVFLFIVFVFFFHELREDLIVLAVLVLVSEGGEGVGGELSHFSDDLAVESVALIVDITFSGVAVVILAELYHAHKVLVDVFGLLLDLLVVLEVNL